MGIRVYRPRKWLSVKPRALSQFSVKTAASFFNMDKRWMDWLEHKVQLKHVRLGHRLVPKKGMPVVGGPSMARRYEPQDVLDIADALLAEALISTLEREAVERRVRRKWYDRIDIEPTGEHQGGDRD